MGGKEASLSFGVIETVDSESVLARKTELLEEMIADKVYIYIYSCCI